jgi:hypothetical protein
VTTVRTQTFFERPSYNGGPLLVYTCPDGEVAVLEYIGIMIGESIEPLGLVTLVDGLVLFAWGPIYPSIDPPAFFPGTWSGKFVLYPGEQLYISTNGATTADFCAAGYTLTLP